MNKKILIPVILIVAVAIVVGALIITQNKGEEQETVSNENVEQKEAIIYKNVEIIPGTEFKEDEIQEEAAYSEILSCAFEGNDKIYTYEGVEVTLALIDGIYKVYEIYCINDMSETKEGVKISDSKSVMIEKYGTEYEEEFGNRYTYTRDNVEISFTVENDVVTGIVYTLKQ